MTVRADLKVGPYNSAVRGARSAEAHVPCEADPPPVYVDLFFAGTGIPAILRLTEKSVLLVVK
jgi:hypothetical protein